MLTFLMMLAIIIMLIGAAASERTEAILELNDDLSR